MAIIKVEGVSIRYLTGDFKNIGLKEYVVRRLKGNYRVTEFWADKNITFSLEKGDMLGIIGTNGAGKSTLLKAVSGIMVPTEGRMEINGTIAARTEAQRLQAVLEKGESKAALEAALAIVKKQRPELLKECAAGQ